MQEFKIQRLNPKKGKKKYVIHKHSDNVPALKKSKTFVTFDIMTKPLFNSLARKIKNKHK